MAATIPPRSPKRFRRAQPLRRARRWELLPRAGLLVLLLVAAAHAATARLTLSGEVRDAESGTPVAGALARAGQQEARTESSGRFQLGPVLPWQPLLVEADGYLPARVSSWPPGRIEVALLPQTAEVRVVDEATGAPVDATLVSDSGRVARVGVGRFQLAPVREGDWVTASAPGYLEQRAQYAGGSLEIRLAPRTTGRVVDAASGRPIPGALVVVDGSVLTTDADGRFELPRRGFERLLVTRPGFRRLEVAGGVADLAHLALEPFEARGLYLSYFALGDEALRGNVLRLLETTEVNAVVIDIKGDRGYLSYRSAVPLAERIGATARPTVTDMRQFVAELHGRGWYVIGRIVTFKDDLLSANGPRAGLDVAIKDARSGQRWVDGEGLGWVDPFRPEAWEYNVALAREAAELGFDEVQFDYVRFPTDPGRTTSVAAATYSQEPTEASRVAAIAGFLERAHQALRPLGVYLSADVFGYTCWRDDDLGIGQNLSVITRHLDYLSPMIYPSTFQSGLPGSIGYPEVVDRPYEVIHDSLAQARRRLASQDVVLRPWLQYFDDYADATGRPYRQAEIEAQKQAARAAGAAGWLMWDPTNRYAYGGLSPR